MAKNNLQNEWQRVPIAELFAEQANGVKLGQGWSPQCLKTPSPSESIWGVLKTTSIQAGYFLEDENKQLPDTLEPRTNLEVRKGDILITCAGPRNRCGVACLVRKTRKKLLISGKMYRFQVDEKKAVPEYIEAFLQTREAWDAIDKMKTGISDSGLNLTHSRFKQLEIPIPSVKQQKAVIEKIEELLSDLENGKQQLETAQQQLKVYRQSLLMWAFNGRLTKTKIETAKLSDHADLITKGASPRWQGYDYIKDETQLLFVTSENVRDNFLDVSEPKYLSLEFNNIQKRSILQSGDVLFNLVGASIGRATVFNLDRIANINQAVAVIRLKKSLSNKYLSYFLNSEVAKQKYLSNVVDVARANLSLTDTANIEVPYCSIKEQQRIVEELESKLTVCDKIEETINNSLQQAEMLKQSILKKAFEGKLVTD